jgi:hypothetical protein
MQKILLLISVLGLSLFTSLTAQTGCTDFNACNFDPFAIEDDGSCTEFIDCAGVCGGGFIQDACGNCYDPNGVSLSEELTFSYSGAEQVFTAPVTATYEVELWGAQGGDFSVNDVGGLGGYANGEIALNAGDILYIYVGGAGYTSANGDAGTLGGFNGGGRGGASDSGASGGGASDIRLYGNELNNRIAVGGGGGGADNGGSGGAGGGLVGTNATGDYTLPTGGTQVAGGNAGTGNGFTAQQGSFGQGGANALYNGTSFQYGGGGGGGWYGGGGGHPWSGGAGGSSYIGGLLNAATQSGIRSGDGLVIIRYEIEAPECNAGCIDPLACNYDPIAQADNGSCILPEPFYDCFGVCIADEDDDGICDELEIVGCIDILACNFNQAATDIGECLYAELYYDCNNVCLSDADEDGICDQLEVNGCTDSDAANFNPEATEEDNSCLYAGCTYPSAFNFNNNASLDDGSCIFADCPAALGCIDMTACNYNPLATQDDGSCDFISCTGCTNPSACNYSALATIDNNSCDFGCIGCTYFGAINYNPNATIDDGSCTFSSSENSCGFGTFWDPITETCIAFTDCPADLNGDGIVNSNDLLTFLGAFGTLCE